MFEKLKTRFWPSGRMSMHCLMIAILFFGILFPMNPSIAEQEDDDWDLCSLLGEGEELIKACGNIINAGLGNAEGYDRKLSRKEFANAYLYRGKEKMVIASREKSLLKRLKLHRHAWNDFNQSHKIFPKNWRVYEAIGDFHIVKNKKFVSKAAQKNYRKMIALITLEIKGDKPSPYSLWSRAKAYINLDKYHQAIKDLDRALEVGFASQFGDGSEEAEEVKQLKLKILPVLKEYQMVGLPVNQCKRRPDCLDIYTTCADQLGKSQSDEDCIRKTIFCQDYCAQK